MITALIDPKSDPQKCSVIDEVSPHYANTSLSVAFRLRDTCIRNFLTFLTCIPLFITFVGDGSKLTTLQIVAMAVLIPVAVIVRPCSPFLNTPSDSFNVVLNRLLWLLSPLSQDLKFAQRSSPTAIASATALGVVIDAPFALASP